MSSSSSRSCTSSSRNSTSRSGSSRSSSSLQSSSGNASTTPGFSIPSSGKRLRLDDLVQRLHPEHSRNVIQSWILQGRVCVNGKQSIKPGQAVSPSATLLEALRHFGVDMTGAIALDSGQSTGGFTDCMLQHGASRVIGIDCGYGQLDDKIRKDPRVTVIERFNLRYITRADVPSLVSVAALDLSFISVLKVFPAICTVLEPDAQLVVLVKPQFEAGRSQIASGGLVRDPKVHAEVLERVSEGIKSHGFHFRGSIESPLKGDKSGNTEFLAHFVRDPLLPITAPVVEESGRVASRA
ncbi:MAG: hypothetical protein WDW38_008853 [Sanguina aurantia]